MKAVFNTVHSKERFVERTGGVDERKLEAEAKIALKRGISLRNISKQNVWLRKQMSARPGAYKKFYNGKIFIFSKNSRYLITYYPVSNEKLLESLTQVYNYVSIKRAKNQNIQK